MDGYSFEDRTEAGQQLARALVTYRSEAPLVLGLPRGGVMVAYEVARALRAPLDVVVARKVGAPLNPEFAIGAVAPGIVLLETSNGVSNATADSIRQAQHEMNRRILRYRGTNEALPTVRGRTVILVDDGLATGLTARAAVQALRRQHPRRLILAVPVCPAQTAQQIASEVDALVTLVQPRHFRAVGEWYRHFEPVTDREVIAYLQRAQHKQRTA